MHFLIRFSFSLVILLHNYEFPNILFYASSRKKNKHPKWHDRYNITKKSNSDTPHAFDRFVHRHTHTQERGICV